MKIRISKLVILLILFSCNAQPDQKKIDVQPTIGKLETPSGDVYRGFLDEYNNLWFGTNNDGLYKYDGSNFVHYTEQDGIINKKYLVSTKQTMAIYGLELQMESTFLMELHLLI